MNSIAVGCAAALGLLLFGLGLAVSMTRLRGGQTAGCATDPSDSLHKLVRAHGNTAEYAPMLAVLILFLGDRQPAAWVQGTMIAATACRYLLAAGIVFPKTMAKPNPMRFMGASGTYAAGIALCVAMLIG